MNADAVWTVRCADRLSQSWGHLSEHELRGIAADLCSMAKWRELAPELAAEAWLWLVGRPWGRRPAASDTGMRPTALTHPVAGA